MSTTAGQADASDSPVTMNPAEADALLESVIFDDEGRQDPVPVYRRLHAESPWWHSTYGMTVVSRYDDALATLRNPRWGRPEPGMDLPAPFGQPPGRVRVVQPSRTMLLLNPPDHTRIRGLVSRAFTPRRVDDLRPRIAALLDPILDAAAQRGSIELMAELAVPFPVAVISELMGVPHDETGRFVSLVRDTTAFIDAAADGVAIERATTSAMELAGYFVGLIEEKRRTPDDGLLSALIEVEAEGDRLNLEELVSNTMLLYAAGFETTSNLIGNGVWALLRHPDQLDRLRADRSLLPSAVWEVLRYDSPVQLNARTALDDDECFGEPVERGTQVMVLQGAANHDATVYTDPDRFDVGRFVASDVAPPLSFGFGAHHCLGAHLARAEGEIVFAELLRRFEHWELDGPTPRYRPSFTLRGLDSMHVALA